MAWKRCLAAAACAVALARAESAVSQSAPGTTFRDCPQCPEMVVIPAGRFVMGAAPGEEEREGIRAEFRGRSQPQVALAIGSFALGRYEVTLGEFAAFAAETGYKARQNCWYWDFQENQAKPDPSNNWRDPGFSQSDRHPVVCVNWNDAADFAAWLARKTGYRYRLPTEAEWEYAARAGTGTTRPWGDSADDACGHSNVWDKSVKSTHPNAIDMHTCDDGFVHTAPVGSFAPNRFGLYDMIGNVWELLQDCWNETLSGMPANGAARLSGDCSRRVMRGGSWNIEPRGARPAQRGRTGSGIRDYSVGFRVARTL